jgi:hypothetical protein
MPGPTASSSGSGQTPAAAAHQLSVNAGRQAGRQTQCVDGRKQLGPQGVKLSACHQLPAAGLLMLGHAATHESEQVAYLA